MSTTALNDGWLEPIFGFEPTKAGHPAELPPTEPTAEPFEGDGNTKQRVLRLLVIAAAALCLHLVLSSLLGTYERVLELSAAHPVAGWIYFVAVAAAWLSVAILLVLIIRRIRGLPSVSDLQRLCHEVRNGRPIEDETFRDTVTKYLLTLKKRVANDQAQNAINHALGKFKDYENSAMADLGYLEIVFQPLHQLANQRIESAACQTALGTALATRHFDLLIITAQAIRLTDQVASIYVGKPSRIQVVRLAGRALSHLLVANIAGLFVEAAAAVIPLKVVSVFGPRIGEGMVNGALMLRFGEAVQTACCPVPPPRRSVVAYLQTIQRLVLSGQSPPAAEPIGQTS